VFRILPLVDMLKKAGGAASGWRLRAATSRASTVVAENENHQAAGRESYILLPVIS